MSDVHPFFKTRLAYQVIDYIIEKRIALAGDLVSYSNDPVRFKRRFRMLINLAEYESMILTKIRDFDTDLIDDLKHNDVLGQIKLDIESIINVGA